MGSVAEQIGHATEHTELFIDHELNSADLLVDRSAVEVQAWQLLSQNHTLEIGYKTEKTYYADARTALFEALTASGHLSKVEMSGTLDEIHDTMLSVHLNAYSDSLSDHEKARQFQELCEELTRQQLERRQAQGDLSSGIQVATISDYPSVAGMSEAEARSLGYRPDNRKGMLRSSRLICHQDGTFTRITEQVSRSDSNPLSSAQFLQKNEIPIRMNGMADVRVLGSQLLHEMSEGVVGIQKRLDLHAGSGIRYGEPVHETQIPYEYLRVESEAREAQAEVYVSVLADYMSKLDQQEVAGLISSSQHIEILKEEIHAILQSICVMRPEYAADCFGQEAAPGFYAASDTALSGDAGGSAEIVHQNQHKERAASLCGMSLSTQKTKELGVEVDSLGRLISLGLELWGTKIGSCRVPDCVSPKPTEVGACDVCTGGCEPLFNRGWSLSKIVKHYRSLRGQSAQLIRKTVTFWDLFTDKPSIKNQNVRR